MTNIPVERQGLLQTFGGGGVVPVLPLGDTQLKEGIGLAVPVTEVTEHLECLPAAGGGGLVVPGQLLDDTEIVEGVCLAGPVAEVAVERQCPGHAGGGIR